MVRDVAALLLGAALAVSFVPTAALALEPERAMPYEAASQPEAYDPAPPAAAAAASDPVEYVDENGKTFTCSDYTDIATVKSEKCNSLWEGWYVVKSNRSFPDYTLDIHGDVNLILCDGVTLNCEHGIRNSKNLGSLTIWAQEKGTGKLIANASDVDEAAGIGGFGEDDDGGKLVVHGGTIKANGGYRAAGIGGAEKGDGGEIVVCGGSVEAWGGRDSAGIGGGFKGNGGRISVLGGSVYSYGDNNAAGLGGGEYGNGGHILISGGYVLAVADERTENGFSSDNFDAAGAGIGGGEDCGGGEITITGGVVEAYGGYGDWGAGAGIGGGDEGTGGDITITGGDVTAYGGSSDSFAAAGIGGGFAREAGNITITGGHVKAHGRCVEVVSENITYPHPSQAIGCGGQSSRVGNVRIDYTKVRALSGSVTDIDVELVDYLDRGTCGECSWNLTPGGALTIAPTDGVSGMLADADLSDLSSRPAFPWLAYANDITSVTFLDGVSLPEKSSSMFMACGHLQSVDASSVDASNAKYLFHMFLDCPSLTSLDISGWDVSNVTSMDSMFAGCSSLASLDVGGWKVSGASCMNLFAGCSSLTSLDLTGWDFSGALTLHCMFDGCSSLTSVGVSGWDVSSMNSTYGMFRGCASLTSLDLSGWQLPSGTDMQAMFEGCSSLQEITVGEGFDTSKAFPEPTNERGEWWSDSDLAWYTLEKIASSRAHVADTYRCVAPDLPCCGGCAWNLLPDGTLRIAPADGVSGTLADADRTGKFAFPWLEHADEITSVVFCKGVSLPADSSRMFQGCSSLASIDTTNLDVSGAMDTSDMFDGCSALSEVSVGEGFDTSKVFPEATSECGKWWSASDLAWYTLDDIATSRAYVADTYRSAIPDSQLCGGCAWSLSPDGALTVAPADGVSGTLADADRSADAAFPWLEHAEEIRSVTFHEGVSLPADSSRMFQGCSSIVSLNASGWDTSGVKAMFCMFDSCSSLYHLNVTGWDVSGVFDFSYAFRRCSSLSALDVSTWEISSMADMFDTFSGCSSLQEIAVGRGFDVSKAFPEATSDTGKWWSVMDETWYTTDEIASSRIYVLDTYLSQGGVTE